jgi:FkbM family methyltransferase
MEYNIVPDKKTGILIREGTYDKQIISEVKSSYLWMDVKDKVVFEVGGCFGAYSVMALRAGAKKVICFEPDPYNAELIVKNTEEFGERFRLVNAACVSGFETEVDFYKSTSGINHGNYSCTEFRGREKVTVKAVNFNEYLMEYQPDTIKMDCEGAEYDILLGIYDEESNTTGYEQDGLPSFVKQIAMEIHFSKKEWRTNQGPRLIKMFEDWEAIKQPKITSNNWHTLGGWKRA